MNISPSTWRYAILAVVIVCFIYFFAYGVCSKNSEAIIIVTPSPAKQENYVADRSIFPVHLPKFWIWKPQPPKARSKVLVWGYFRGGSTFASKLVSRNNDTVYFFEPLWLFEKLEDENDKGDFIQRVFNCDDYLIEEMKKYDSFLLPLHLESQEQCMEAGVIVAKVNRLYGEEPLEWLVHDPSIQIVHVFRDPRAVYASRKRFGDMQKGASPKEICDKMRGDLDSLETLPEQRYLRVRLEDIAKNPIETAKRIYDFTNQEFTQKVRDFLEEQSKQNPVQNSTPKEEDSPAINAAIEKLSSEELQELELQCRDIIDKLMY